MGALAPAPIAPPGYAYEFRHFTQPFLNFTDG